MSRTKVKVTRPENDATLAHLVTAGGSSAGGVAHCTLGAVRWPCTRNYVEWTAASHVAAWPGDVFSCVN